MLNSFTSGVFTVVLICILFNIHNFNTFENKYRKYTVDQVIITNIVPVYSTAQYNHNYDQNMFTLLEVEYNSTTCSKIIDTTLLIINNLYNNNYKVGDILPLSHLQCDKSTLMFTDAHENIKKYEYSTIFFLTLIIILTSIYLISTFILCIINIAIHRVKNIEATIEDYEYLHSFAEESKKNN